LSKVIWAVKTQPRQPRSARKPTTELNLGFSFVPKAWSKRRKVLHIIKNMLFYTKKMFQWRISLWSLSYMGPIFSNYENNISKFYKILKKILDVDNDVLCQKMKSQLEIPYIMGLTKVLQPDIICRTENLHYSLL
jgi:hypothetical protein